MRIILATPLYRHWIRNPFQANNAGHPESHRTTSSGGVHPHLFRQLVLEMSAHRLAERVRRFVVSGSTSATTSGSGKRMRVLICVSLMGASRIGVGVDRLWEGTRMLVVNIELNRPARPKMTGDAWARQRPGFFAVLRPGGPARGEWTCWHVCVFLASRSGMLPHGLAPVGL